MNDQPIPSVAQRPDYNGLRLTTAKLQDNGLYGDTNDSTLDEKRQLEAKQRKALADNIDCLFPSDASNQKLRNEVMDWMRAHGMYGTTEHSFEGGKLDQYWGMVGIANVVESKPEMANAAMVNRMAEIASHGTGASAGGIRVTKISYFENGVEKQVDIKPGDSIEPLERSTAQEVITKTIAKRPELATADLVRSASDTAIHDPDSMTRYRAQETLSKIAEKRPDLINGDMLKAVKTTAAQPLLAERGELPLTHNGPLWGNQSNELDNSAMKTAQQTLKTITEKRPDLTTGRPTLGGQKAGHVALNATIAAPRPNFTTPH